MNSAVKNILIFVSGAALGATGMYFSVKKAFELKADLEISEMKEFFEDKINELEDNKSTLEGEMEGPEVIDIKEKVKDLNNKPDLTDYTKYFKDKGERINVSESIRDAKEAADNEGLSEEELAEMEGPQDDEPYTDEEDRSETINAVDYQLNGESKKAIEEDRDPYEIEPSDYELTCSNYEKQSLIWYHFDQILADENEEEVLDFRRLIGDIITSTGFADDDTDTLYVRNDKLMCDFEISKIYEAFRPE